MYNAKMGGGGNAQQETFREKTISLLSKILCDLKDNRITLT